ncbi:uncharacterized protein LOC107366899 [Tetranychus urticae]|uniref:Uncharacterized protein n=1 Tax=Tetranychus urticae TaxID=32264 RepID=T1KT41_TETUR|nr:uncharacterized protein LOC107366899 [Tetranychus urticae]
MNPLIVLAILISISSTSWTQSLDQSAINGNGANPSIYPFLPPPPPPPPMGGPPHAPGVHGPGHVHVPHPEGPHELFRQTPRHGPGLRGPSPGPYATGLRLPPGYPIGFPPQQFPSPYPNTIGDLDRFISSIPVTTSTVECSCSISFAGQNISSLALPRSPSSLFPGVICGPASVSLCRIQCMAQALNATFDLMSKAVNPTNGNGVSLQQYLCNNQQNSTSSDNAATASTGNNGRLVYIKSETSCSEQSTDFSSSNRRTESMSLGSQECNVIANIGSFQPPSIISPGLPVA